MGKEKKQKQNQQASISEYNLSKSLSKIRNNHSNFSDELNTDYNSENSDIYHSFSQKENHTTGTIFNLNEKFNDKYNSLNKDFSDKVLMVHEKISSCEQNLRDRIDEQTKNLTTKINSDIKDLNIDDKIGRWLFGSTISALILIASLIYLLSYAQIVEESKKVPIIEARIKNIEDKIPENKK